MAFEENIIVPDRDEEIPGEEVSKAAAWLSEQGAYGHLPMVALNGNTALFWYVAALLTQYKRVK